MVYPSTLFHRRQRGIPMHSYENRSQIRALAPRRRTSSCMAAFSLRSSRRPPRAVRRLEGEGDHLAVPLLPGDGAQQVGVFDELKDRGGAALLLLLVGGDGGAHHGVAARIEFESKL